MLAICVEVRNCALCITKSFSNLCLSADNSADMGQDVVSCPGLVGHWVNDTGFRKKSCTHTPLMIPTRKLTHSTELLSSVSSLPMYYLLCNTSLIEL